MGLFDGIARSLFGDGGEGDIRVAGAQATGELERGFDKFRGTSEDFLGRSTEFFNPDIDAGRNFLAQLIQSLSPEGSEEAFQRSLDGGIEAIDRSASARGLRNSGGTQKELFNFGQRNRLAFDQDRLSRKERLSGVGSNAAAAASGQTFGTGQNIGNAQFGLGQLRANNLVGTANAAAQAGQNPINNLVGLATAAARVAGAG